MYGIIDHLPIHNILTSVPCSQSTYGNMRKRQSDDEQTIDGTCMSSENEDFRKDNPLLFSSSAFSIS